MKRFSLLLTICIVAPTVQAGEPSVLPRYQALEKGAGAKLLRVLGSGELPVVFTRASGFSADGKTAAYVDYIGGGEDKTGETRVLIWDVPAGRTRSEFVVPGQVSALALAADGSGILIGAITDQDKTHIHVVSQWNTATGKRVRLFGWHKDPVFTLAFSPKENQFLSACWSKIKVWDLTDGKLHKEIEWPQNEEVTTAVYLPDGKRILYSVNENLRVLDLTQPDPKKPAAGQRDVIGRHEQRVLGVAISPDGKTAVSAALDDTLRSWDLVNGKPLHVLKKDKLARGGYWISFGLAADGKTVLSCWSETASDAGAGMFSMWDATTGKEAWTRPASFRDAVPIHVRAKSALMGGGCNMLAQVDLDKGAVTRTWGGPKAAVSAVRADARGRLYSAGHDGLVHIWEKDQIVRSIQAHAEPILAITLDAKETRLFTASADKTVKVWDVETGKLEQTLSGHTASVTAVVLEPTGKLAYTGSGDRSVKSWDLVTGKVIETFTGHSEGVNAVAITPNEGWLASGSDDATIRIWPIRNGKLELTLDTAVLEGHKKPVTCLTFIEDGKTLLSGSQDQTLKVWDRAKGKLTRTIPGHKNWITSLLIVDADTVFTTSDDLSVCWWNLASGKEMGRIDFGLVGDCPRCAVRIGRDRLLIGSASWSLYDFQMLPAGKSKKGQGSSNP